MPMRYLYVFAALLICVGVLPAHAATLKYDTFTLSNGMDVAVIENHKVPAVSHMVWYRTGSSDDPQGKSGIAHFLEHLMFKGTPTVPAGEFSKIIARHGGRENAFTSYDYTAYYQKLAKAHLPLAMEMEADRMRNLVLDEETVATERDVILEERRMRIDNRPASLLAEQMRAALFLHHPYGTPNIGWQHEIKGLNRDDALKAYRAHYAPKNAVLIVIGDITADELRPLAEKYYGSIPSGERAEHLWITEPEPRAARQVTLRHANVNQPQWSRYYLAPSQFTEKETPKEARHSYPLLLLSEILGGGETSRLYRALVMEQKIATSASSSYDDIALGPSIFALSATPAKGKTPQQVQQAVMEQIERLQNEPIGKEELAQAKTQLKAGALYAMEGLQVMGYIAGQLIISGEGLEYFNNWDRNIDAVTAEQIQEAARAVLQDKRSVTGILLPEEAQTAKESGA